MPSATRPCCQPEDMERLAMVFLDHSEAYIRAPLQVGL
jgi:hypothetical protein